MADEPTVTVRLPGLLRRFADGNSQVTVEARTVRESVETLFAAYPALEPHLLDGDGALRPHLVILHNGSAVDILDDAANPVEPDDEIVVLQAVSGGRR